MTAGVGGTEFVSAFGDGIVSGRDDHISFNFQYGISTYDTATTTVSTGSVLNLNSMEIVSTGISATGSAALQSVKKSTLQTGT